MDNNLLIVSNGTVCDKLYEVLDAIAIYPELVNKIIERARLKATDDLNKNRIRELKSKSKDIYTDNAFGAAIANSISGTKAILRYGEFIDKKPGIIYGLGPVLDCAFAGLLAGCLTKILDK
jgi:phosphatidylglycerophosphatase A